MATKFLFNPISGELNLSLNNPAPKVEYRTLTAPEISAGQLTLVQAPRDVTQVQMGVQSAPIQVLNEDFLVTGSVLSWSGLGLDGILSAGDKVCIVYSV